MAASPPRSIRGRILNNLQRQLETITVANGYSQFVYKVTTDVKAWRDTPEAETPVLYLIDDITDYRYHAGRLTERAWTISVFGVMKNTSQMDMEELISDIEMCLQANVSLWFEDTGKVLQHHRITGILSDNQLFSEIEGTQLFKINLEMIYTACVDAVR